MFGFTPAMPQHLSGTSTDGKRLTRLRNCRTVTSMAIVSDAEHMSISKARVIGCEASPGTPGLH